MKSSKTILITFTLFAFVSTALSQDSTESKYEMKRYFFVMLTKGPNRSQDSVTVQKLQEGHMANISKMAEMKKLAIAGPFLDEGLWRGIFILNVETAEEAKQLIDNDPAVKAGRLSYEIHPWYGARGSTLP
jgi:uncharacterized protein YciI